MILNRFMWEDVEKGFFRKNKRIKCVVKFEEVIKVQSKNVNQKNKPSADANNYRNEKINMRNVLKKI